MRNDPTRNRDLAIIHCLKRDNLHDDEELYRDLIGQVAPGQYSSGDLNRLQRRALIGHLRRVNEPPAPPRGTPGKTPLQKLAIKLWIEAGNAGALDDPSPQGLRHFVERQTGVMAVTWLNTKQAQQVVEGIKSIWQRHIRTRNVRKPGR